MVANAEAIQTSFEYRTITCIAITNQMAWGLIPRKRLGKLLRDPFRSGMEGGVRPDQFPALQVKDCDAIEKFKPNRRHDEEIDGCQCVLVVFDKRLPVLASWPRVLAQILTHSRLSYPEPELEQLAVDA